MGGVLRYGRYGRIGRLGGVLIMSHQLGQRGCGGSSVSDWLVADLTGDDLPYFYVRLFESLRQSASEKDD